MSLVIDLLATCSIVGIWPRYIEPRRLKVTELSWSLERSEAHLDGLKIAHLTDLHFHAKTSKKFLDKIVRRLEQLKPDVILFTGDFLCYSRLEESQRLAEFLFRLQAPLGSFCSFGNHDYARYVSLNRKGVYDAISPPKPLTSILRGVRTLLSKQNTGLQISDKVCSISMNETLCHLLSTTPFKILENETITLPCGLNLTGLGDLALGRCQPDKAFTNYDKRYPGIVLSHNPDTFPRLLRFPGSWILCGHTHGEQIHFPWPRWAREVSRRLARLENSLYTRGLFSVENKKLYINRGLGSHKPFRLFSPPEICLIRATKT